MGRVQAQSMGVRIQDQMKHKYCYKAALKENDLSGGVLRDMARLVQ